ncbi:MAG TPA: secretin N-terminal domain-containing protein, partial [Phycisphaerae bacterium]|nr:secretin N-terminal domain-containing protein [Phycisphaerae bacterium]
MGIADLLFPRLAAMLAACLTMVVPLAILAEEAPPAAGVVAPPPAAAPAKPDAAPPPAAEATPPAAAPAKPDAAPPAAAPAKPDAAPPAPAPALAKQEIRFQFDGIPYDDVVRRFAQMAGKPIIGEFHVEGTLTFFDPQPYTFDEAFDTLNLLLAMRGFTLVDTPRYLQVVAVKDATKSPLRIVRGWDQAEGVRPGELVTMMLPLKYMTAEDAVRVLMPVVSTFGSVAALGRGRGIIITDRLENLTRIRVILDELDTGTLSSESQLKTFKLKHASARDVATVINGVFGSGGPTGGAVPRYIRDENGNRVRNPQYGQPQAPQTDERVKATADQRTNTLFLIGPGDKIALAEQVVEQLDAIEPSETGDMRIFNLKNARAEDLANTIKQLLPQTAARGRPGRPGPAATDQVETHVVADTNTNRLIVTAPLDQMVRIENLIRTLDQASEQVGGLRVFKLKMADAQQLATVVSNAIRKPTDPRGRSRGDAAFAAQVSADTRTNSLIVSGTAGEIQTAEKLIEELDNPLDKETREIHVVRLKVGDARQLAESLSRMLAQPNTGGRRGGGPSPSNARVEADTGTNSLLISAAPGDWPTIEKILKELETSAVPLATPSTRLVSLKHARASDLAASLNRIYQSRGALRARGRSPQPSVPVVITADDRSNSLLVSAAEDDQKAIAELIQTMDAPASAEKVEPLRIIALEAGDAVKIAETLKAMQPPTGHGQTQTVFIQGDEPSNSLVVRAPEAEFKTIEEMAAKLDKAMTESGGIKTFQLKVADAQQLAGVLQNALAKHEPGRRGSPATPTVVSADVRTNSLIVAGPAGDIQTAEKLIAELDKPLTEQTREIHVVQLKVGDARELAQALTRMLAQHDPTGRRGGPAASNVRVEAESGTNSLLISAAPGDWPTIEELLEQLKVSAIPLATATTRLVPLKHADARQLAETLREVYAGSRTRGGGSRSAPGRTQVPVVIAANERTNSLLISAADDDQKTIAELIQSMDVAPAEGAEPVRIIRPQSADATKLAETLKAMVPKPKPGQTESVVIQADPLSNSVLIRGSEADRKVFEEMIASLDEATQQQVREVRMIPLKHVSAAKLAQMLGQLYPGTPAPAFRRRGGPPAPMPDQDERVVIAAAPGDRTLVIDGPRDKIEEIAKLVTSLDVADSPGQIEVRTYRLANAKAPDLAASLGRLFAQQQRSRGGPETDTEPQPRFEADPATNQILVAATPTQFETIDDLIKQLEVGTTLARETKTYRLKAAKATDIVTVLQAMLVDVPETGGRRGRGADTTAVEVRVAAMPETNDVVVQGPPEKLALAEELIKTFDMAGAAGQAGIVIVKLKNAQAASLAEAVNTALASKITPVTSRPGRAAAAEDRVTVTPELNSNSVLVRGPSADIPAVVEMIKSLDEGSTGTGTEVRVFPLVNGEASALAASLGKLFQDMLNRQAGRGKNQPTVPFSIAADDRTQSLVVSTTPPHFALIEQILKSLDEAPATPEADVQYIWLENADATEVASQLNDMYKVRKGVDKPVITADTFSNAVTLIAKDADLKVMEPIIAKLDDAAKDNTYRVRVIPLTSVKAEKMAEVLRTVYKQMTGNDVTVTSNSSNEPAGPKGEPGPVGEKGPGDPAAAAEKPGVTIAVDKNSNSLIISGKRQDLEYLQDLVDQLMLGTGDIEAEFRTFKIEKADPESVARTLDALFNPKPRIVPRAPNQRGQPPAPVPPAPPPVINVVADTRTRCVIVRAKPMDFEDVEILIKQLDQIPTVVSEVRIFPLKNTDAAEVATNLKDLFQLAARQAGVPGGGPQPQRGQPKQPQKPQPQQQRADMIRQMIELRTKQGITQVDVASMVNVTANKQTNAVIVTAPADAMEIVAGLIREIDQSGMTAATSVRMYPVTNADIKPMVDALREVFTQPAKGTARRGTKSVLDRDVVITGDEAGRLIIVSAPAEEHELVAAVIKEMDEAQGVGEVAVKVYRLQNAEASAVASALTATVRRAAAAPGRKTGAGTGEVRISADSSSNSVVVRAAADEHAEIAKLIQEMDQATAAVVKTYPVKNADVATVVTALKEIFASPSGPAGRGGRGGAQANRVTVTGDEAGRLVIVSAPQDKHELIAKVIDEVDQAQDVEAVMVKVYHLEYADAASVETALQATVQKGAPAGRRRPWEPQPAATGQVRISADRSSNSLVVRASAEDHERIAKLIEELDVATTEKYAVRLVPLKNADPTQVAQVLNRVFVTGAGGGRGGRFGAPAARTSVVIEADRDARMLAVRADDEMFEKIKTLASQLDTASPDSQAAPTLIPLKFAQAAGVATAVGQAFETPRGAGRGAGADDRVTVVPEPMSNSLIVTAGADNLEKVRGLVAKLDTEQTGGMRTELLLLKDARAIDVAPVLQQMARSGAGGLPGRRGMAGGQQPAVVVSADAGSNGLVISGPAAEIEKVVKMAQDLDKATGEVGAPIVKTYPIKNADIKTVVTALKEIFVATSAAGGRGGRGTGPDPTAVVVTGDETGRLVIVSAPAEKHTLVAKVIAEIDQAQSEEVVTVKVYRLENADASAVGTALQQSLQKSAPETRRRWWEPEPAATGQVRISADRSSNSLVVRAGAEDHERIVKLLKELDVAPSEKYAVRLIPLTNADPTQVAQVLNRVFVTSARAGGGGRWPGGGGGATQASVVIEADRDARMLAVRADDEMFEK